MTVQPKGKQGHHILQFYTCEDCHGKMPPVPLLHRIGNYLIYKCPHINLTQKEVPHN